MASTGFSFGSHWSGVIKDRVATVRYGSTSETVRNALRRMGDGTWKRAALKANIESGLKDAKAGRVGVAASVFSELRNKTEAHG